MITEGIKNIIFDLGNVVVDIDIPVSFARLAAYSADEQKEAIQIVHEINEKYEVGGYTSAEFRTALRRRLSVDARDAEIDEMWNSVLVHLPLQRIELIRQLASKYRLFVLSNTNALHIAKLNSMLQATAGIADLKLLFEKVYYSHKVGLRKPDHRIYHHLLIDSGLKPSETLFIDDMPINISAACETGIKGVCLQPPHTINSLLDHARS